MISFNLPLQCDEKHVLVQMLEGKFGASFPKILYKSTSDIHFLIIWQNSNGTLDLFKVIFYFLPMISHHWTTILRNLVGTFSNHRTSKIQTGHPLVMSHRIGNQSARHLIYNEADVWTTVRGQPSPTDFRRRCLLVSLLRLVGLVCWCSWGSSWSPKHRARLRFLSPLIKSY